VDHQQHRPYRQQLHDPEPAPERGDFRLDPRCRPGLFRRFLPHRSGAQRGPRHPPQRRIPVPL
ncbi:hypothetical protein, partial [Pseudomonas sp. FG-3G]